MSQDEKICNFLTYSDNSEITYISDDIIEIMKTIRKSFQEKDIKAIIVSFVKEDKSFII